MAPSLSLIIPVYNDAKEMASNLEKVLSGLSQMQLDSYEILVVDDGSRDKTPTIVRSFERKAPVRLLSYAQNRGKGFAVAQGMLQAKGAYRFFTDSDLSTPLHYLQSFLEALQNGSDIVIASRYADRSHFAVKRAGWLNALGFAEKWLIRFLSGLNFSDTQCGFKGFRAKAAEQIFSRQKIHRFCFDVEALFLAQRLGFSVQSLPVEWRHDHDTRVRFHDPFLFVRDLLRLRWYAFTGQYF